MPARAARRQHADPPVARCSIGRFRSPTTSTRRSSSSRGCRACSPRRWSAARSRCRRRRVSGAAAQSARVARHARRLGGRGARRDAGDHVSPRLRAARHLGGAAGQLRRLARRARRSSTRCRRRGAAARRAMVLLLGGRRRCSAALGASIAFVQYLADFTDTFRNVRWLMGSLDVAQLRADRRRAGADGDRVRRASRRCRACSISISLGSESAAARGVDVERAERVALVSASLATGAAVSLGGPMSVRRHHRAAPGAADRRRRSPAGAAGVGAVRRRVSHRLRPRRAHDHSRRSSCRSASSPRIIGGPFFLWLLFRRALKRAARRARRRARRVAALAAARRAAAEPPRRIVSLVPATTEMLFAMGAGDRVVGVSSYDRFPPEVERLPRVGGAARSRRRADPRAEARTW